MRVRTGVPGFDDLVGGGLPKGSCTLISGKCGTGKTIFSMQYIYSGIVKYGEPGVFVSFEREPEDLHEDMRTFGWHLGVLENQGNLEIMGGSIDRIAEFKKKIGASGEDMIKEIIGVVQEKEAERLAVDGLAQFSMMFPDVPSFRMGLARLQRELRKLGCTSVLTTEVEEGGSGLSRLGVEEYVADGVIVLYYEGEGSNRRRFLEVRKMRGTPHSDRLIPFRILDDGIKIARAQGIGWVKGKSTSGRWRLN